MKKKTIQYTLDPDHLPPLTDKEKAERQALDRRPHSASDTSDIPTLTNEFFENAERGCFHRPPK